MSVVIQDAQRLAQIRRPIGSRRRWNQSFVIFCVLTAFVSVVLLAVLLGAIVLQGVHYLNLDFLLNPPNAVAAEAGVSPAMYGTIWVCAVCACVALPIGVASAVFLEEFKPRNRLIKKMHGFLHLNISTLAGVPSVVYGIIGLTVFANMLGQFGSTKEPALEFGVRHYDQFLTEGDRVLLVPVAHREAAAPDVRPGMQATAVDGRPVTVNVIGERDPLPEDSAVRRLTLRADAESGRISRESWYYFRLPFGRSVLTGGLTLMLVILPILIVSTQESLRSVPSSLREAALGMGATRWQTIRGVTLPAAIPGIMTGSILAMSRAIGEAAPVLIIAGIVFITSSPGNLMDDFTVMPLQIFNWVGRPQAEFHQLAASGIIVLLVVLLSFNGLAVLIRQRFQKRLS